MPVASVAIVLVYYLVATANGMSHDEQLANGWLFHITESEGGVSGVLRTLSLSDIDWHFVASVIPQMLTIVFLAILYASMSITALKAESDELLNIGEEFHHISTGNVFCAAMCSPPGFSDVVSTSMYKEFGASSRWLALVSSAVGILIAVFGGSIIGYLPKMLMGATIFLFAFQTMYECLYRNVRGFSRGSLIGELSAYLYDKHRTATVIADEDSVIYHLDPQLDLPESDSRDLKACIHEMVAMTLAERVSFMNNRLLNEAS